MDLIKVTSIEQLDELLDDGNTDFTIASGVIRSSKYITKDGEHYFVCHNIDSSEERLTAEELMASNIGASIRNGNFYCECEEDEEEEDYGCDYEKSPLDYSYYEDARFL